MFSPNARLRQSMFQMGWNVFTYWSKCAQQEQLEYRNEVRNGGGWTKNEWVLRRSLMAIATITTTAGTCTQISAFRYIKAIIPISNFLPYDVSNVVWNGCTVLRGAKTNGNHSEKFTINDHTDAYICSHAFMRLDWFWDNNHRHCTLADLWPICVVSAS